MLATLEGPIRIQLHTLITIRGTYLSQVIYLQINPHTRSILGRTYCTTNSSSPQVRKNCSLHTSPSPNITPQKTSQDEGQTNFTGPPT
jgi:hypothetical protein